MRTSLAPLAALLLLSILSIAAPLCASTRTYYHRVDRELTVRAEAILVAHGLSHARVRVSRARVLLSGELPSDATTWDALRRELLDAGALTVLR